MNIRPITALLMMLIALPAIAQELGQDADLQPTHVDTTFTIESGRTLRYKGELPDEDHAAGMQRAKAMEDERVPLGYGWRTIRTWREGDLRPEPVFEPGRVLSEFIDLSFSSFLPDEVGKNMSEFMDFAYFAVKDALGWTLPDAKPLKVWAPHDAKAYFAEYGLCWWVPGDMWEDGVVVQPIQMITARGIAMEALTHLYVEWQLRRKTGDRLPYWFMYGAGAFIGGEGWILKGQVDILYDKYTVNIGQTEMLRDIELFRDREIMRQETDTPGSMEDERSLSRIAYWRAFKLVENIIAREGIGQFKSLIDTMEAEPSLSFADAVQRIYGKNLDTLILNNEPW